MQSGVDRRAHLLGEEVRKILERNRLDAALDQTLVAGQAREPSGRIDAKRSPLLLGHLREVIRYGVHVIAAVPAEQAADPSAAAAQADYAELHLTGERGRRRLLILRLG
jgi:hypothetical protein